MEQPYDVPQGYSVEKSMDRAWMQVEAQPIQQFWKKGFGLKFWGTRQVPQRLKSLQLWTFTDLRFRILENWK